MAHAHQPALLDSGQAIGGTNVGGKDFERGVAVRNRFLHLGNDMEGNLPDEHTVVRVVTIRVAAPSRSSLVNGLRNVDARMLDGKIR